VQADIYPPHICAWLLFGEVSYKHSMDNLLLFIWLG